MCVTKHRHLKNRCQWKSKPLWRDDNKQLLVWIIELSYRRNIRCRRIVTQDSPQSKTSYLRHPSHTLRRMKKVWIFCCCSCWMRELYIYVSYLSSVRWSTAPFPFQCETQYILNQTWRYVVAMRRSPFWSSERLRDETIARRRWR